MAMDTAFNLFAEVAKISGVEMPVIFETETKVIDGFGNQVTGDSPRLVFCDNKKIGVDDEVEFKGETYVILSLKKECEGYLSAELGKTKN